MVKDPMTSEWIDLRHLGTKENGSSLGAMFVGRCADGRRVQVTLIGKPSYAPKRFEYGLTFTNGSKERMFYGLVGVNQRPWMSRRLMLIRRHFHAVEIRTQ
jgi:hypothetical protein